MSETTAPVVEFNFKHTELARIPLSKIRENATALRTVTNKESVEYQEGLDSVRKKGVMNPILVRELKDPTTGDTLYGLIDGLHRFNWALDAGMSDIPAQIGSLEDADVLEAQILGNVHKIETKAVQYTKALLKILGSNPSLTITELAARLSRSVTWLNERLGLLRLDPTIQARVDSDAITLTNAFALARLPIQQQLDLADEAASKSPAEFVAKADAIRKEIETAKRQGRQAETDKFIPAPRLQSLKAIKEQAELATKTPAMSYVAQQAKANGVETVEAAVAFAFSWIMHMDPASLAADEAKWKADKEAKKAAADKRAKEKALKAAQAVGVAAGGVA